MKCKRLISGLMAGLLLLGCTASVQADLEDDLLNEAAWAEYLAENAREEAAYTEYVLDETYGRIYSLYDQMQELEYTAACLSDNLFDAMVNIELCDYDIACKEDAIAATQESLAQAQADRDEQYSSMKLRIQYIYEKGGDDAWFQMMLNAEDVGDLLTRAEYTQKMYEQDRDLLQKYIDTIESVKALEEQYEAEKAELEAMRWEYTTLSWQLDSELQTTRANADDCEYEIACAQDAATEYAYLLEQQTAEIANLEAMRDYYYAAADEAAYVAEMERQAAAAAAAEAEAAAAAQADAASAAAAQGISEEEYQNAVQNLTVYTEDGSAVSAVTAVESGTTVYNSSGEQVDASSVVSAARSSSGNAVVDFATQFVGNPYVWGGTSLTNGADCSGFVQSVYANFGVNLPRTSYEQQNAGVEVSYADAQPGDLICYGGHVAIYMGDGQIVHAADESSGIKISNNAAYRTITSVRRLV